MSIPNKTQEYVECKSCKKSFITYIKRKSKYCSYKCMGIGNRLNLIFKCDNCGKECSKDTRGSKSKHHFCGIPCLREYRKNNGGTRYKHGMSHTPEQRTWDNIKRRCYSPDDVSYYRYGGRGIKMCDRWRNSFQNFYHDMGKRPSDNHSIDRIDVNGDYEPGNCRWVNATEQARNKRNSLYISIEGERLHLKEVAEKYKLPYDTVLVRYKSGKKIEDIIKPISTNENRLCKYGHLIADNPYIQASGKRECRKCVRRRQKEYAERLKARRQ